jgi:hypothetical protein
MGELGENVLDEGANRTERRGVVLAGDQTEIEDPEFGESFECVDDLSDRPGDRMPVEIGTRNGVVADLDADAMCERGATVTEELLGDRCEFVRRGT